MSVNINKDYKMTKGTVKWYDQSRGFGFIKPDDGSNDVFVHATALHAAGLQDLRDGQNVQFDIVTGQNGKPAAENLTAVEQSI